MFVEGFNFSLYNTCLRLLPTNLRIHTNLSFEIYPNKECEKNACDCNLDNNKTGIMGIKNKEIRLIALVASLID